MLAKVRPHRVKKYSFLGDASTQCQLHSMLLPGTLLIIVFSIIPLAGIVIAFTNYRATMGWQGILTADWNSFWNFRQVFRSTQLWPMIFNTLGINLFGALLNIPVTILFALLLNEITLMRAKSFVQTATYLPHFLSWSIYGGLIINLLSSDGGGFNVVLQAAGLIQQPISWLAHPKYFWAIAIITNLCKELGWGAIIYLAAIAGVDPTLYEAAAIDGAKRHHRMLHVTFPAILPTVVIMVIFAVAGMLNNNFTQIYVLQNALNQSASQVIDTFVYQIGMQQFQFSVATAASLFKSVFALMLLTCANLVSKKITNHGLF